MGSIGARAEVKAGADVVGYRCYHDAEESLHEPYTSNLTAAVEQLLSALDDVDSFRQDRGRAQLRGDDFTPADWLTIGRNKVPRYLYWIAATSRSAPKN